MDGPERFQLLFDRSPELLKCYCHKPFYPTEKTPQYCIRNMPFTAHVEYTMYNYWAIVGTGTLKLMTQGSDRQ